MGNALKKKKDKPLALNPTGIYPDFHWDRKVVRRMIQQKRVAPFFTPIDDQKENTEECPICFNFFIGGLNSCVQCKKRFCSECYFQVRRPTTKSKCPLCMHEPFEVRFTGPLSAEEMRKQKSEEDKVNEMMEKREEELPTPLREEKRLSEAVQKKVEDEDFFNVFVPAQPSSEPPKRIFNGHSNHRNRVRDRFNHSSFNQRRQPHWGVPQIPFQQNNNIEEEEEQAPTSPIEDFVPRIYNLDDPRSEERMLREAIRMSLQGQENNNNNSNNEVSSLENNQEEEEEEEEKEEEEMGFYQRVLLERKRIQKQREQLGTNNGAPGSFPSRINRGRRRKINFFDSDDDDEEEENKPVQENRNDNFVFGRNDFEEWLSNI